MTTRRSQILKFSGVALAAAMWLAANDWINAGFLQRAQPLPVMYADAGLTSIYKGTLEINGETTQIEVFSARGELPAVASRFAAAAKEKSARAWFHVELTGAMGFAQQGDRLSRYFFAQLEPRQTLLYALHQSYPPQVAGNADALPGDFPVYPGASLDIAIHHRETGTRLATYSTGGLSAVVLDYFQMTLVERGWTQMGKPLRDDRTIEAGAQVAFRRGSQLCVINCEPHSTGDLTIVVLLKDTIP